MTTGDRIKELRIKLGLSQSKLAARMDTDPTSISRWERGKIKVSQKFIVKLAKELSTTSDYLLGKTNLPEVENTKHNFDTPEYMEKLIQANQMVVYEHNGDRLFIPATPDGFNFYERVRNSNQDEVMASLAAGQ